MPDLIKKADLRGVNKTSKKARPLFQSCALYTPYFQIFKCFFEVSLSYKKNIDKIYKK